MYISANGVDFITSFEGLSLKAYKALPTEKYWTIGYGHYGADVSPNDVITEQQAKDLFAHDIGSYCRAVDNTITVDCTQAQFDMMTSLCYNIGTGGFRGSSVASYLNQGKVQASADAFLKWVKSGGAVISGLVRRRNAERVIFLNGYSGGDSTPITPPSEEPPDVTPDKDDKTIIKDDTEILTVKLLLSNTLNGWYR
jgi:GH24 family phage-related lysozyme (muramidase)